MCADRQKHKLHRCMERYPSHPFYQGWHFLGMPLVTALGGRPIRHETSLSLVEEPILSLLTCSSQLLPSHFIFHGRLRCPESVHAPTIIKLSP